MFFTDDEMTAESAAGDAAPQEPTQTLDEIMRLLHRMLALAELSASDLELDRQLLQKALERDRDEIDRLADGI